MSALPDMSEALLGPGAFLAVVGPSGVGKDSLIRAARAALEGDARFAFPRRWITREPDATEDCESLSRREWERRRAAGRCFLSWEAHGIAYAIPDAVRDDLANGRCVVANLSRRALPDLARLCARPVAVVITATPETLAERLRARGREDEGDRRVRLAREPRPVPASMARTEIRNDETFDQATNAFLAALLEVAGATRVADR